MNTNTKNGSICYNIFRNWTQQSNLLKEKYPQLTDEDLKLNTGKEIELYLRIGNKIQKTTKEVVDIIIQNEVEMSSYIL